MTSATSCDKRENRFFGMFASSEQEGQIGGVMMSLFSRVQHIGLVVAGVAIILVLCISVGKCTADSALWVNPALCDNITA